MHAIHVRYHVNYANWMNFYNQGIRSVHTLLEVQEGIYTTKRVNLYRESPDWILQVSEVIKTQIISQITNWPLICLFFLIWLNLSKFSDPCFNSGEELTGLARGDAEFVLIIHSNPGGLGKKDPLGKLYWYIVMQTPKMFSWIYKWTTLFNQTIQTFTAVQMFNIFFASFVYGM